MFHQLSGDFIISGAHYLFNLLLFICYHSLAKRLQDMVFGGMKSVIH